jgi:hypothetical protein
VSATVLPAFTTMCGTAIAALCDNAFGTMLATA